MMLKFWQFIRCIFAVLFFGPPQVAARKVEFQKELAEARMANRASRQRLTTVMNDLLQNLEYDRIVHHDGVIPLDPK